MGVLVDAPLCQSWACCPFRVLPALFLCLGPLRGLWADEGGRLGQCDRGPRPCLRVISRAPGLKLVVETLISSLKPIGNIVLICCAFFIIFGILGVQVRAPHWAGLGCKGHGQHSLGRGSLVLTWCWEALVVMVAGPVPAAREPPVTPGPSSSQ